MLLELDRNQAKRERRAIDRNRILRFELHDQVRQPANVVLMAVGEDDAHEPVESLGDVRVVRHDEVDAVQFRFRELDAGVDDDQIVFELDQRGVLADLADAAQGTDAYLCLHTCYANCRFGAVFAADMSP